MNVSDLVDTIVAFVRQHEAWTAPVVFMVAFLESICFFSIIWPGTAILVGLSALLAASGVSLQVLMPSIIAAGLGGSVGYALSYWIGLRFKDSITKIWPFTRQPELIPHGQRFFERHGAFGVFLGHFFGPVRAVIPVVAGMFAMRQLPFQIANVTSAFLWAAGVIAPSFLMVTFKDQIFGFMLSHEWLVAAVLGLTAFVNAVPQLILFIPTLILFAGIGALHLYAGGHFVPLFVAGAAGAFAGDLVFYSAGARLEAALTRAWYVDEDPETIEGARSFLDRWRWFAIAASKFLGLKRAVVPAMAGAQHLPKLPFAIVSAVSAAIWSAALLAPVIVYKLLGN